MSSAFKFVLLLLIVFGFSACHVMSRKSRDAVVFSHLLVLGVFLPRSVLQLCGFVCADSAVSGPWMGRPLDGAAPGRGGLWMGGRCHATVAQGPLVIPAATSVFRRL